MAGLENVHKKPGSVAGLLNASRCVQSNTRCYKSRTIPREKVLFHPLRNFADQLPACWVSP
jgi:hypothetical protein